MDKEIAHLHTKIGRSKFAIFLIIGFLFLITYLLITVSKQVSTPEAQISTAPRANYDASDDSSMTPQYALPTCSNFEDYFQSRLNWIDRHRQDLGCPAFGEIVIPRDPEACMDIQSIWGSFNQLHDFFTSSCQSCPVATPTGVAGLDPSPAVRKGPTSTPAFPKTTPTGYIVTPNPY